MTGLRERNKSKRRSTIVDAAMTLLRDHEFAEVTIDQVAALAEVSPHTVYNLVGTRDDLAYALMGRIVVRMADTAPLPDELPTDPSEPLRALTEHLVSALVAEQAAYRTIVRAVASLPRWPGGAAEPIQIYTRAAAMLEAGGALRTGVTPALVSHHALLGMFGAMMAWARGRSAEDFRDDARVNLAIVLAGTTTGAVAERALCEIAESDKEEERS